MLSFETASLFLFACIVLAMAPGPDNIFVLTQSALFGPQAGVLITLGLCTGVLVHTSAVALGVAAVFATSEVAFTVLKTAGALYLLYLAWQAFTTKDSSLDQQSNTRLPWQVLYRRGIFMNVTNPKVTIFFLAFLPQFVEPAQGPVTLQIFLLGAIFIATAFVVFSSIAWFAGLLGTWLRSSARAQTILNRIAGTVFAAMAARLVLSQQ